MKFKRLIRLLFLGFVIYGLIKGAYWSNNLVEKLWPISPAHSELIAGEMSSNKLNDIKRPDDSIEIQWHNSKGNISGIVHAWKWEAGAKTYLRIQGPVPAEYKKIPSKYTMCTVYLAHGFKTEKFWFDLIPGGAVEAWRNWPVKQKLQDRYCQAEIIDGLLRLTIMLPKETILGNIVFGYEEFGLTGWIATERKGSTRHDNMLEWILQ